MILKSFPKEIPKLSIVNYPLSIARQREKWQFSGLLSNKRRILLPACDTAVNHFQTAAVFLLGETQFPFPQTAHGFQILQGGGKPLACTHPFKNHIVCQRFQQGVKIRDPKHLIVSSFSARYDPQITQLFRIHNVKIPLFPDKTLKYFQQKRHLFFLVFSVNHNIAPLNNID